VSKVIYVVGYPKSGNTWLSRLLGDCLNSPIKSKPPKQAIADEGYDRPGKYIIRQEHLRRMPKRYHSIVYIYRDPRDICVSVNHYWQMRNLTKAIKRVGAGDKDAKVREDSPIRRGWIDLHKLWYYKFEPTTVTTYECLFHDTERELGEILENISAEPVFPLDEVVARQDFKARKTQLSREGNKHPYGKKIQLHNLRRGIAGDWINHFDREQAELADLLFGEEMLNLGYIENRGWWKDVEG